MQVLGGLALGGVRKSGWLLGISVVFECTRTLLSVQNGLCIAGFSVFFSVFGCFAQ